jgi:hypothetical protein
MSTLGRSQPATGRRFVDTVRDGLIADCPQELDIDMPGDGSQRWVLHSVLLAAILGALLLVARLLAPALFK